jgi:hypothetical protein
VSPRPAFLYGVDKLEEFADKVGLDDDFVFVYDLFFLLLPISCRYPFYAVFKYLLVCYLLTNYQLAKVTDGWSDQREIDFCLDEVT